MTTNEKQELFSILRELTYTMQQLVKQNQSDLTNQIYKDFLEAKTIKEKIWIAEALEDELKNK